MIEELSRLTPFAAESLWRAFAVFVRVGAFVSLLPVFGEQSVPMRVRLVIVGAFTLIVVPTVPPMPFEPDTGTLMWLTLTETLAGVILGIGIRLFVLGLQTAGSIAAQSTSLSQILGGAVAEPLPAMGYILIVAGLALAVMLGLHVRAAELMILSYDLLPMGQFPTGSVLSEWGLGQVRSAFVLAFTLAAPFVILSVLYNLALGAINKAMPQLMVAFVGAPVITAGGLFLLFLASPLILKTWVTAMNAFLANPFEIQP